MKALVFQVPHEFEATLAPDPGPASREVRPRALSPLRDDLADPKAVLAP